jgi:hypothetical protein
MAPQLLAEGYNYSAVKGWTVRPRPGVNVFSFDRILIPVNVGNVSGTHGTCCTALSLWLVLA